MRLRFLTIFVPLICIFPSCKKDQQSSKPTYYRMKQQQLQSAAQNTKIEAPAVIKKNPKTLTIAELQIAKEYSISIDNKSQTIVYLENMLRQCSDPNLLKDIYLELGDLYFEQGNMTKASALYTSYITLYPGSPQRAYVHYQAILCRFYTTFSIDRDQTKTEETLQLTKLYLDVANIDAIYKEYNDDVAMIQKQCFRKLYSHEMDIVNFYYKKGNYKAAQLHLDEIKKTYVVALHEEVEPEIINFECTIATKLGNTATLLAKQTELQTKYPQAASLKLAANTHKTDHVGRF